MPVKDATQRFSSRVGNYVRYRPGYPSEAVQLLRSECGLSPESLIADIASGTGIFTQMLLENGNRVFGVEPNDEMRRAGERFLGSYSRFTSVAGTAEATTLPDHGVDLITAAQAAHWFDRPGSRREFVRILKPGGWMVIAWNDRRMDEAPFTREYENILERFGVDYKKVKDSYPEAERIRRFLTTFSQRDLPNHQILDWDSLSGRLRSSSFTPTEGHPNFAPMMADLKRLFDAHQEQGQVRMDYFMRIYYGQLQATA